MADNAEQESLLERRENRFRTLVCVDGSDDSYRGLEYAAAISGGADSDIILLYVRPIDQGLRTGGLQVRVARENMLSWGLELPGIKYLNQGRDLLVEHGDMALSWDQKITHTDVAGDPLGDNKVEYRNAEGKSIVLKLKTAPNIATGILDQYELGPYNLIILGASGRWGGWAKSLLDPAVAEKVAIHAPCSVMVTRQLERGHGHLICTDGSERAVEMVHKAAELIHRTEAKRVSVMSVAVDVESEPNAKRFVEEASKILEDNDLVVREAFTRVGTPVETIIEAANDYSIIVMGDTGKTGLKRYFMGSVAFKVMEYAERSVMIIR